MCDHIALSTKCLKLRFPSFSNCQSLTCDFKETIPEEILVTEGDCRKCNIFCVDDLQVDGTCMIIQSDSSVNHQIDKEAKSRSTQEKPYHSTIWNV